MVNLIISIYSTEEEKELFFFPESPMLFWGVLNVDIFHILCMNFRFFISLQIKLELKSLVSIWSVYVC